MLSTLETDSLVWTRVKTVQCAVSQGVRFVGWQEKIVLLLSTSPRVADSAGTKLAKEYSSHGLQVF